MDTKISTVQFIADSVTSMIGYWDSDLCNQFANAAYADWFGLTPAEITGKHLRTVIGEERFVLNLPYIEGVLRGIPQEFEREIPCRDGQSVRHALAQYRPHLVDGKVVGFVAHVTDISAVKRAQQALSEANALLEQRIHERTAELNAAKVSAEAANRAKTLFLGNMSHEMRTPLHQISGVASLFRRDSLSEKQMQRIAMLETAVKRLDTVIGGILTLVDIESAATVVNLQPVDMERIVSEVVAMSAGAAADKGLRLEKDVEAFSSPLLGDAKHLTTILCCLCSNAITYSDKGTVSVRLRAVNEDAGSITVRIEVRDEGIGIAPEQLARMFEYFEQVDNSHTRKYGGTGVGLAIVKKLAWLMGGDAGCESVEGRGSTFWVTAKLVKIASARNRIALAARSKSS